MVICRPGIASFVYRLIVTAIAVGICAGIYSWGGKSILSALFEHPPRGIAPAEVPLPNEQALRETGAFEDAALARMRRENAERLARDRQRQARVDRVLGYVLWPVLIFCGLAGVLAPISALWQGLYISSDMRRNLVVRQRGAFGLLKTRSRPLADVGSISTHVQEIAYGRRAGRLYRWRWLVSVMSHQEAASPPFSLLFSVVEQGTRPGGIGGPPERVKSLLDGLEQVTGIQPAPSYEVSEVGPERRSGVTVQRLVRTDRPLVSKTRRTFQSRDEVPAELRPQVEAMRAEAEQTGQAQYHSADMQVMRYRDSTGRVVTATSLDELPPELRARFEEAISRAQQEKTKQGRDEA
ncbi:MAG TPA: hypothetical protein ENN80_08630 [Candidatus Hydrogenedentes bacterium]|nr:hypothetical protein [Candidatus Hydrogenedentota bacterium]